MRINRIVSGLFAFFLVALVLFLGYVWIALNWSYSNGERAGYLQKFSSKGWVCKTWEGELLMTTVPGVIPEKFEFSVRDPAIAGQLMAAAGKRVVVSYAQHKSIPSSCFGDSQYFVERVQISQQP